MPDMLEMFNLAIETGKGITSVVTKLSNYHVLIIDEWLLDIPSEKEVNIYLRYLKNATIHGQQSSAHSINRQNGIRA